MSRGKQARFAKNTEAKNLLEPGKEGFDTIKGNWKKDFFKNDKPITLEMGCGRGEYTVGLGRIFSDRNFIGIDIKGSRICNGSQIALNEGIDNVGFLRTHILFLSDLFENNEVDEIWVTFPDPRPKDRDIRKRLISPRYLDLYRSVLKKGGIVHLKTDNKDLYDYSLELVKEQGLNVLANTDDLYASHLLDDHHGLQTTYEKRYISEGFKINYLKFELS